MGALLSVRPSTLPRQKIGARGIKLTVQPIKRHFMITLSLLPGEEKALTCPKCSNVFEVVGTGRDIYVSGVCGECAGD